MSRNVIQLPQTWQQALSHAIKNPEELIQYLQLDSNIIISAKAASKDFSLRVPYRFIEKMEKGNPHDPLLRQILPIDAELKVNENYSTDPLGEHSANRLSGILHKYKSRVLLIVTSVCGINCRYCFRRHFNYTENNPGTAGWENAVQYIAQDKSIKEVIFSGGDPLVANDKKLAQLAKQINEIPHVTTLRIHTRMPIVLPERITDEFIDWFSNLRLKPIMVIHCNHPKEIDSVLFDAMQRLKKAGVMLFNQSVLLKGVNDNPATLIELSEKLFEIGVLPYYLHLLDKVQGASHFHVSKNKAKNILNVIMTELPGYLIPKLVYEKAGALSKLPV
ncbi:MAG: L-lysine 2,3-aminomutase [Legionellaceae bacterium]